MSTGSDLPLPVIPPDEARAAIDPAQLLPCIGTVRDAVRVAVSAFESARLSYGQGTLNSYDDAVALVYWTLHLPLDAPDTLLDARISDAEARACVARIRQRTERRMPVAFITGEAWLRGLRFNADPRALIPRSVLVEAIQEALPHWRAAAQPDLAQANPHWPLHVLDLCTGGGSIAIHAAGCFPDACIMAIDIDPEALAVCAGNVAMHGLQHRIAIRRSDLLEDVAGEVFDLVLCNPPYVPAASMDELPPEFRHEPVHALAGGSDGMTLVRRLLDQLPGHLSDDGLLLIEIGHEHRAFEAAFPELPFHYLPVAAGERMIVLIACADLPAATRPALR